MAFNHTTTFLRSAILEDPFRLGDLLGPEDVLRIEKEYPELFSPMEIPGTPVKGTRSLERNLSFQKRIPPITSSIIGGNNPNLWKSKSLPNVHPSTAVLRPNRPSVPPFKKVPPPIKKGGQPLHKKYGPLSARLNQLALPRSRPIPSTSPLGRRAGIGLKINPPRPRSTPSKGYPDDLEAQLQRLKSYLSTPDVGQSLITDKPRQKMLSSPKKSVKPPGLSGQPRYFSTFQNTGVLKPIPTLIRRKTQGRSSVASVKVSSSSNKFQLGNASEETAELSFGKSSHNISDGCLSSKSKLSTNASSPNEFRVQVALPDSSKYILSSESSSSNVSTTKDMLDDIPDFIRVRSDKAVEFKSREEKETSLVNASIDRCEQLLLAKLLASKYEKEGKIKKKEEPSLASPKKKRVTISEPPLHELMFSSHRKQNVAFEKLLTHKTSTLKNILHELIYAEVAKLLSDEKERTVAKETKNVGVSTDQQVPPVLEESNNSPCYSPPTRYSPVSIPTPSITPPVRTKSNFPPPPQENQDSSDSTTVATPSKTLSDEKLHRAKKLLALQKDKKQQPQQDGTDCSELEDFVASEPVVITPRDNKGKKRDNNTRIPTEEPCITEVSTPEFPTPLTPFSPAEDQYSPRKPHQPPDDQEPEKDPSPPKQVKSVQLQVVPEELENFDLSELESSLNSILDVISEGEFVKSEEKSPGEISYYYYSPGLRS